MQMTIYRRGDGYTRQARTRCRRRRRGAPRNHDAVWYITGRGMWLGTVGGRTGGPPKEIPQKQEKPIIRWYDCGGRGHVLAKRPSNALYCGNRVAECTRERRRKLQDAVYRSGTVEGQQVDRIVLDTGSSRTLVRSDLVPVSK